MIKSLILVGAARPPAGARVREAGAGLRRNAAPAAGGDGPHRRRVPPGTPPAVGGKGALIPKSASPQEEGSLFPRGIEGPARDRK